MTTKQQPQAATECVAIPYDATPVQMANPPLYQGSTIMHPSMAELSKAHQAYEAGSEAYTYGRKGTPTSFALTERLAQLEGGYRAYLCPSGLAAITTALLSQLSMGDHVLMVDTVYSPTRDLCEGLLRRMGVHTTYYDPLLGAEIETLIQDNTRVIFLESPGSITLEIQDLPAITAIAKARGIVTILDNTWATPLYFKSFAHGVDIVVQAVTKYIGGHSDVLMGAVIANQAHYLSVRAAAHQLGQFAGGNDIALVLRGLRTLPTRLKAHAASAFGLAQWFEQRPEVAFVRYPALPSHPQHAVWLRDFTGASGLFTVAFKPQYAWETVCRMVESYQWFGIGYSWGGFESLALPVSPAHLRAIRSVTPMPEGVLVRYQIGLEELTDLRADLERGLQHLHTD